MTIKNFIKDNPWFIGLILWILAFGIYNIYPSGSSLHSLSEILSGLGWMGITIGVYLDAKNRGVEKRGVWTFFTFITAGIIGLFFYLLCGRPIEKTWDKNLIKDNPWFIGLILWILGLIGVILDYRGIIPDDYFHIVALFGVFGLVGMVIGVYLDARIRKIRNAWVAPFFTLITAGLGLFFYLLTRKREKTLQDLRDK
jgi:hypothetical protein